MQNKTLQIPVPSILSEFIISPSVLRSPEPEQEVTRRKALRALIKSLMHGAIVRDLRAGEWSRFCLSPTLSPKGREFHPTGRELVKKLKAVGRLREFVSQTIESPTMDQEWMNEIVKSAEKESPEGVICDSVDLSSSPCILSRVCPLNELLQAEWWQPCRSSVRPRRNLEDYKRAARFILECANSIAFIDPHFDPSDGKYKDAIELVCSAGNRVSRPRPTVEVHRRKYKGSGRAREDAAEKIDWESVFREYCTDPIAKANLSLDVYLWDDFHDRYLISNIAGISLQNGFDTTADPNSKTTWCLMSRADRDEVQKEFDFNSTRYRPRKFTIPG